MTAPQIRRRRDEMLPTSSRRSRNACTRCKAKKLRCRYDPNLADQTKCVPCNKSEAVCEFDVLLDGVPTSATRIKQLEEKICVLEAELAKGQQHLANVSPPCINHDAALDQTGNLQQWTTLYTLAVDSYLPAIDTLAELPTEEIGEDLVETAYRYTQARYCIVDWVRIREWHSQRKAICYSTTQDAADARIGCFFLWIIYAIGSQLRSHADALHKSYYSRARQHLDAVLKPQDLITLQAFLTLVQYSCRVSDGPSHWSLVGATTRLCVGLGLHRKRSSTAAVSTSPRTIELEKRFFWSAYCYDRMVVIVSQRPFAIHDLDIDAHMPVDVDVDCMDEELIRDMQLQQASAGIGSVPEAATTLTAALHHIRMYRIRSRIYQRFMSPCAQLPVSNDVQDLLNEIEEWKCQALIKQSQLNPLQQSDRVQAMYLQTVLLLFRPILAQQAVDPPLLKFCAMSAADACESAKSVSLNPESQSSPVIAANCFYCGITLLQCLTFDPTCLPLKRTLRAIAACSTALAVYSRTALVTLPVLQMFDMLSDRFLGSDDGDSRPNPGPELLPLLNKIMSSDLAAIAKILHELSQEQIRNDKIGPDSNKDLTQWSNTELIAPPIATSTVVGSGDFLVQGVPFMNDFEFQYDYGMNDMHNFWVNEN